MSTLYFTPTHHAQQTTRNTHTLHLSIAPSDYSALADFLLGPFSNTVRRLSFNVSIVDDMIPENNEDFTASLTLALAGLGNRVTVDPDLATVTIEDDDGNYF